MYRLKKYLLPKWDHSKNSKIKKDTIEVTLPEGTTAIIDIDCQWILDTFPSWQRVKGYVVVSRTFETEYGYANEEYYLHRLITKAPPSWFVDHKNRNGFDNRKENLRFCTQSQNAANTVRKTISNTGYRGVFNTKRKLGKPFRAYISTPETMRLNNKKTLGYFKTAIEAAMAYDKAALEIYGEFAILNLPKE